jgi:hypothetical protein
MASNYVTLVNKVLTRMNEVLLDTAGDGFANVRNVQALAKDAVNHSVRLIIQDAQEWPFLKTTYTQTLAAGTRQYDFQSNMATVDWDTFYLKKLASKDNTPTVLRPISYEEYIQSYRGRDDTGDASGDGAPVYVYQTYEEKFGVTPVPDAAYEVEYVYWTVPSDMTLYDDTCVIPSRFDHVIIDGAIMFMMRFRSNEQSAAIHQNNFEDGIKAMRRVLIDDDLAIRSTVINRVAVNGR